MKTEPLNRKRCDWPQDDELMCRYHDEEWGVPVHEDRKWFEYVLLDAFQAGLSWRTILYRREGFRKVFHDFDPVRVARMTGREIEKALQNPAIIRNRLKVEGSVKNARAFLRVQQAWGSFDAFIWSFTKGKTVRNGWKSLSQIPARTPLSDEISKALKKEGFTFVGTTICYAFLQAGGIVNDHLTTCFRYRELAGRK